MACQAAGGLERTCGCEQDDEHPELGSDSEEEEALERHRFADDDSGIPFPDRLRASAAAVAPFLFLVVMDSDGRSRRGSQ